VRASCQPAHETIDRVARRNHSFLQKVKTVRSIVDGVARKTRADHMCDLKPSR
jgi:hypothetical protein